MLLMILLATPKFLSHASPMFPEPLPSHILRISFPLLLDLFKVSFTFLSVPTVFPNVLFPLNLVNAFFGYMQDTTLVMCPSVYMVVDTSICIQIILLSVFLFIMFLLEVRLHELLLS